MVPTIYGGAQTLPAQSAAHLRKRKVVTGCNAGRWLPASGKCGTCMPLVQLYSKASAPLTTYCQHRERREEAG